MVDAGGRQLRRARRRVSRPLPVAASPEAGFDVLQLRRAWCRWGVRCHAYRRRWTKLCGSERNEDIQPKGIYNVSVTR
jgi:hypothetical protein